MAQAPFIAPSGSPRDEGLAPKPRPASAAAPRLLLPVKVPLAVRHRRPVQPVHFPVEAEVPEGFAHLLARTFVFQLLAHLLGDEHTVGSDQFVYWNARDRHRCLSPDVFVKLGRPPTAFGAWTTWEQGGVPELCLEIVSPNESDGAKWDKKLEYYEELGTRELLRFDPEAPEGTRLRAWDREAGDWVERLVEGDTTPCRLLGLLWVVRVLDQLKAAPPSLRLMTLEGELLLDARETEAEGRRAEAEGRRLAEARVRELEDLLAKSAKEGP